MVDTNKLLLSLNSDEGNIGYVYDDANGAPIVQGYTVKGNPTIGIGRLLTKAKGLSLDERNILLANDVQQSLLQAQSQPWWPNVSSNDARSRAMVEMVFNMGISSLQTFIVATTCLCKNDFDGAATAFLASKWATQVGHRAQVLAEQIRTGTG